MEWEIIYYSEDVRKIIEYWPIGIKAFYARLTERINYMDQIWGCHLPAQWQKAYLKFESRVKKVLGVLFSAQ